MVAIEDSPHVSLLVAFANTVDVDEGTERLDSPEGLLGWLTEQGLAPAGTRVTRDELAAALRLRDALRNRLRAQHDGTGDGAELAAAAAPYPLRLAMRDGVPVAAPTGHGVPGALAAVVAAIVAAQAEGALPRLKICAEDTCQWAFVDASKNRSRQWCSMSTCGNRAKTRTYRSRRRTPG